MWMQVQAASAGLILTDARSTLSSTPTPKSGRSAPRIRRLPKNLNQPPKQISPNQLLHISMALQPASYRPSGSFDSFWATHWQDFVGRNVTDIDAAWLSRYQAKVDFEVFSPSEVKDVIRTLMAKDEFTADDDLFRRLTLMALSGDLAESYPSAPCLSWVEMEEIVVFLKRLAARYPELFRSQLASFLECQGRHSSCTTSRAERLFENALELRRRATETEFARYQLAHSLIRFGSHALSVGKSQKAVYFFDEATDILKSAFSGLAVGSEGATAACRAIFSLFQLMQQNFARCVRDLGQDTSVLRLSERIIRLAHALREAGWGWPSDAVLAGARHDFAFGLSRGPASAARELWAAEEAVDSFRVLARRRPAWFVVRFETALYNFSVRLLQAGQYEEALRISLEESSFLGNECNDTLVGERSDDALARSWTQEARCYVAAGNLVEGIASAKKAVAARRASPGSDPSCLVEALHVLSIGLWLLPGYSAEALGVCREALDLQRQSSESRASLSYRRILAVLLHNFAKCLLEEGQHDDALEAAKEVLQLTSKFGGSNESDVAFAMSFAARCTTMSGKSGSGNEMAEKCLTLAYGIAVAEYPSRIDLLPIEIQLAETLFSASFSIKDVTKSIQAAGDAAAIYGKIVDSHSALSLRVALVRTWLRLGAVLASEERYDEALVVSVEAVDTARGLGQAQSAWLPSALYGLAICLAGVGDFDKGEASARECLGMRRAQIADPGVDQPNSSASSPKIRKNYADALLLVSSFPSQTPDTNLLYIREAILIYRALLSESKPGGVQHASLSHRLMDALQNLAVKALMAGSREEALEASEEAVAIATDMRSEQVLVNVLYMHANALCEHGRFGEAAEAVENADDIFAPSERGEAGAVFKSIRARYLIGVNRLADGLVQILEGLDLYKGAVDSDLTLLELESFTWFLFNICTSIRDVSDADIDLSELADEVLDLVRCINLVQSPSARSRFETCLKSVSQWRSSFSWPRT
ncbi:unnamed protein product [Mycena citricolor]|uniref:Uncharacterized protein n=1 Tax=Mycena citricolor TaxID=2018698 RepID=A0AAD2Q4C1_9AGAR|nr:unnamed protein product [Mycena citricolor]